MAEALGDEPRTAHDPNQFNRERAAAAQSRREQVLRLRAAGMTLAQIGAALGISKSRAGQLHAEGLDYREKLRRRLHLVRREDVSGETPIERLPLSDRLRRALKWEGVESLGELFGEDRALLGRRLLRTPNVNRKGVQQLLELLSEVEKRARASRPG